MEDSKERREKLIELYDERDNHKKEIKSLLEKNLMNTLIDGRV